MSDDDAFYALVGRCLTDFVMIEEVIRESFLASVQKSYAPAIYELASTFEKQLDLFEAILDPEELERWKPIRAKVRTVQQARNMIAHSFAHRPFVFSEGTGTGRGLAGSMNIHYGPVRLRKTRRGVQNEMTLEELRKNFLLFTLVSNEVAAFAYEVALKVR